MPPICVHLAVAYEAAERLGHPVIELNLGGYLLGATLPDVHIITGVSREETHFFKLKRPSEGSGVKEFFRAYPGLVEGSNIAPGVKTIAAGYLSHLVTDETWIKDIYLPFFSPSSPLGGTPLANLMDRVLQYELDCRERQDRVKMVKIEATLCDWDSPESLDFLPVSTLREWHRFVCIAVGREPSWERFPMFAQKFLLPQQKIDPKQLEEFLGSLPSKKEQIVSYVPPQCIQEFKEKAVRQTVIVARGYLN